MMQYRKIRVMRSPPMVELRVKRCLARLIGANAVEMPPKRLMPSLRDYVESLLLAEHLPPTPRHIKMLIEEFSRLVAQANAGKPVIYKKRNTLSLMFDVCALQSEMRIENPDDLVLGYTQSMMGFLLFKPDPQSIGMVGLGGGSLAKFCYRYLPRASVEVAEIDPQVIALRSHFCIPNDDERFSVRCMDGADFVRESDGKFDVLMVDGFDKSGQPPQLCSQRFYDDCYQALKPDGILVVNLLADIVETDAYIERMHRSFNDAVIEIDALDSLNKILFCCKGNAWKLDQAALKRRVRQLDMLHPMVVSLTAQNILVKRRAAAALEEQRTADMP